MATGRDDIEIPSRIDGSDAHASDLDAISRFVLSQIDGRATAADIADATMLDPTQVDSMLRTFARKGLVRYAEPVAAPAPPTPVPLMHGSSDVRVDAVFAALATATHYEILGVDPESDKALLKRAYFVLSKEFHPDSSPHRKIPAIRPRLEAIFRRLTDAHDALGRPKRREAYDAELARAKKKPFTIRLHPPIELPKATEADSEKESAGAPSTPRPDAAHPIASARTPTPVVPPPASAEPATRAGASRPPLASSPSGASMRMPTASTPNSSPRPASVRQPTASAGGPTPAASSAGVHASPVVTPGPAPSSARQASSGSAERPPAVAVTSASSGSAGRPAAPSVGASSPVTPADRQKSLLRALHGASQMTRPVDKSTHYEQQGAASEATGDFKSALSFYRVAAQLAPDREDIRAKIATTDRRLAESEVPANREKAKTEEAAKRFETAAVAWSRVCLGAPSDVEATAGAARCLLEAGLDLRQARDFAQRSVDLAPNRVEYRIVLIRVYQGAGMRLNARREAEAAAKLDPSNQLVKNLQRELE